MSTQAAYRPELRRSCHQHGGYNTPARDYRPVGDAREIETVDRNPYKYKYQGQERQDELGLNWDSFKWRNYDYAIGRWMNVDPLVEETGYAYLGMKNNPVNIIDPDGRKGTEWYRNGNTVRWFDSSAETVTDADGNTWSHFSDGYSNNTYKLELGLVTLGPNGAGDWSLKSSRSLMFDAEGPDTSNQILANINSQISDVATNLQVRNEYIVSESTAKAYERAYHQWYLSAGGLGNSFAYGGSMLLPEIGFARGASYLAQGYKTWSATRVSGFAPRAINYSDEAYRIIQYPRSPVTGRFVEGKQSFLSYGCGSVPSLAPSPMRLGVGYTYGLNSNASVATKWGMAIGGTTASQVSLYLYYQQLFKISK